MDEHSAAARPGDAPAPAPADVDGAILLQAYRRLLDVSLESGSDTHLVERAMETIAAIPWPVPHCTITAFVVDEATGALRPSGRIDGPGAPRRGCGDIDPADCLCGRGLPAGERLLTIDTAAQQTRPPCDDGGGGCVHLVLPLAAQGRTFGVLHLQLEPGCRPSLNEQAFLPGAAALIAAGLMHRRVRREQLSLESQFHQAQRMEAVGRLAGGVAHDFNNILTAITNYADLGLLRLEPASPLRRNLEEILSAADRAALLTQQLLAFSRRQVLSPRLLDLNAIIAEMTKMLRRLLGSDIELAVRAEAGIPRIFADPGQIEQIIINLALNARDAMPGGGRLSIETAATRLEAAAGGDPGAAPTQVRLRIVDTGAPRILEPSVGSLRFLPAVDVAGRPGTGLGLAAVEGIVRQNGGRVLVDAAPGVGTAFSLYFPAAPEEPAAASQPSPGSLPRGTETVLLAEDDDSVRIVIVEVLRDLGYRVLESHDGPEALSVAAAYPGRIDLLLTDVVMPGMSGTELHGRLLKSRSGLRLLLVSGDADDAVARHGVVSLGLPLLQKPFSPWALASRLRAMLDAPAP